MRFAVVLASFVPHAAIATCHESLLLQRPIEAEIIAIQQSAAVGDAMAEWERHGATVYRPGRNLGTCRAWNWGLETAFAKGYNVALLLNDDMILTDPRTLTQLRDIYVCQARQLRYLHDRGYSAICISKIMWDEVGPFDIGFHPAFFEDNDHHWRCKVAQVPWDEILIDSVHGNDGSSTLKADVEFQSINAHTFNLNRERYRAKWGAGPHEEIWTVPWNGGPAQPGIRERLDPEMLKRIERPYEAGHA